MTDLSTPYKDTILYSKVCIKPHQLNNDLYLNLKNNLKKNKEKKNNEYGYITKIYKILDFNDGEVIPENFDASVIYNVSFSCRLCKPILNQKIICKIEFINKLFIKSINGPIISVTLVKSEDISNKFNINNLNEILYKSTNKKLNPNDYVTIIVKGIKFESKEQKIIITSHLDDIPNEDEIKEYFNEKFDSEKIEEIKNEIEENSDNEDDNKNYKNDNYMDL
tara:strand:+ start:4551 stop:5216 length:666 start_codon:yes stop_codon:yes gene_type:complete